MTPPLPTCVPTLLRAGDTWAWTRSFGDYAPADGWVLSYAIASRSSATQAPVTWDAAWVTDDGQTYTVTIPADTTADLIAGHYDVVEMVTLAGARHTLQAVRLDVLPDLAQAAAGTNQSYAETMLAAVRAEIQVRVTGDGSALEAYGMGPRQFSKVPLTELRAMEATYSARVAAAQSNSFGRRVAVTFTDPARSAGYDAGAWTGGYGAQ